MSQERDRGFRREQREKRDTRRSEKRQPSTIGRAPQISRRQALARIAEIDTQIDAVLDEYFAGRA